MTVIGHLSDLHVDERGRIEDLRLVLDAFLEDVKRKEVDLIVCSGDLYERRSTPAERTFLASFLQRASQIAPVAGVKGNHDVDGDLEILNRLDSLHPIYLADRPTALVGSAWGILGNRHGVRFGIIALPWVEKSRFAASLAAEMDSEESTRRTIAALEELLVCLRAEATRVRQSGAIPILVAHVMLGGSAVSTGQLIIGQGVELSPTDLLDVGCAYAAVGHVHASQQFYGGRVAYAGSPQRQNFGETERKGYRLVTLDDDGGFLKNEFIELPARAIRLIEHDATTEDALGELCGEVIKDGKWSDLAGALVRLQYRIRAEDLHRVDEANLERALLEVGAEKIQLEAIIQHDSRARAPDIVEMKSMTEKLDAFFRAKEIDVTEEQRERLHVKLSVLEAV